MTVTLALLRHEYITFGYGSGTLSLASAVACNAGDKIVITLTSGYATADVTSVTANSGAITFTQIASARFSNELQATFYADTSGVTSLAIDITTSFSTRDVEVMVAAVRGAQSGAPFDHYHDVSFITNPNPVYIDGGLSQQTGGKLLIGAACGNGYTDYTVTGGTSLGIENNTVDGMRAEQIEYGGSGRCSWPDQGAGGPNFANLHVSVTSWKPAGGTSTPISCLASSSSVATVKRGGAKALLSSSSSLAALARSSTRTARASSPALAALARSSSRTARASSAAVAALAATKVKLQSAPASSSAIASRALAVALIRRATSSPIASSSRSTGKLAPSSSAAVAALIRSTAKTARASSAGVAALVTGKAFLRAAQATSAANASATSIKVVLRTLTASSSAVATLSRSTARSALAASGAVASAARATTRTLLATSSPVSSLARATAKLLRAISAPIASLARGGAYIPPTVPAGRNVDIVEKGSRAVTISERGSRHVDLG